MAAPRCQFTYPDETRCLKRASAEYVKETPADELRTVFVGFEDYCLRHTQPLMRRIDSKPTPTAEEIAAKLKRMEI